MEGNVTWISFIPKYLQWISNKDLKARLGVLGIVSDESSVNKIIQSARKLQNGTNEVFLDLNHNFPDFTVTLCKESSLLIEIWILPGISGFIKYDEKEILDNLNPYVTGVTVDKYIYAS